MKHSFSVLFIGLLAIFSTQIVLAAPPADIQDEAKNSFIFQFSSGVDVGDMPALAATLTREYQGSLRHVFTNVLQGFSATMSRASAIDLVRDPDNKVDGFVNNGLARVPGAGGSGGAKGGKGGGIGRPQPDVGQIESWGVGVIGSRPATGDKVTRHAWIIDTGIDDSYSETELNIGEGANFVSKGKDTTDDTNGHGTHIAGILAAIDNNTGVLGVAAGATVHPVRVLHNSLWGTTDDIYAGAEFVAGRISAYKNKAATRKDVHVVNMSLTIEWANEDPAAIALFDSVIREIADTASVAVCAGNYSADVSLYTPAYIVDHPNVYTVASIDNAGLLASNSNYGPQIDFVAPGVAIESLKPGGGTWFFSGCSMATPHVAGILLFQEPAEGDDSSGYPLATF